MQAGYCHGVVPEVISESVQKKLYRLDNIYYNNNIVIRVFVNLFFIYFGSLKKMYYVYCFLNTYVSNKYFELFNIFLCVSAKCKMSVTHFRRNVLSVKFPVGEIS